MITYDRLWVTLKEKGITQYKLINKFAISPGQLNRIKHNNNINTHTIDMLCNILNCNIEDIIEYKKDNLE